MANKRQRPWQDEFERQRKTLVNEKMMNATDSNYMKQVYDKTNSLLFEGAKKIYKGDNAEFPNKLASSTDEHSDYEMEEGAYNSDSSSSIQLVSSCDSMATQCGMDCEYDVVDKEKSNVIQGFNRAPSPYAEIKDFSFFKKLHNKTITRSPLAKECVINNNCNKFTQVRLDSLWLQKSANGSENRNYGDPSPPNTFKPISPQIIPKDDDDVNME